MVSASAVAAAATALRVAHSEAEAGEPRSTTSAQAAACVLDSITWSGPDRVSLPGRLREVSGLALLDEAHLLAHDDERGIIAIIDVETGERTGQFTLGPLLPRDDFEGIAVLGDRLYLASSRGRLYEAPIGEDGQTVEFRVHETGLRDRCELEGLTADTATQTLLLSCKNARSRELRDLVTVFAWSVDRAELAGIRFQAPEPDVAPGNRETFRPSAIDILPDGGLLLLSGADRSIAVVAPPGEVRCSRRLASRHRQAEGLALLPGGGIAIADEGNPGRLTLYTPVSR